MSLTDKLLASEQSSGQTLAFADNPTGEAELIAR